MIVRIVLAINAKGKSFPTESLIMAPEEYEKCLVGLNSILKEAWAMSQRQRR
jgi:hypothetical protein